MEAPGTNRRRGDCTGRKCSEEDELVVDESESTVNNPEDDLEESGWVKGDKSQRDREEESTDREEEEKDIEKNYLAECEERKILPGYESDQKSEEYLTFSKHIIEEDHCRHD